MIMKMHSYMNINGYLSHVRQQAESVMKQLRAATNAAGGWDEAIAAAEARHRNSERSSDSDDLPTNDSPASSSSNGDAQLRQRAIRQNHSKHAATPDANFTQIVTTGNRVLQPEEIPKPALHPLVDHPDESIASLAREYSELEAELVSTGPEYIRWPNNITYKNFATYMLIPSLVYELEYPRTERYVRQSKLYRLKLTIFSASARCMCSKRRLQRSARLRFS